METPQLSPSPSRAVKTPPIRAVFAGFSWPRVVRESLITASDDRYFDHYALLRWAEDGGRWVGESNSTLHEVHT